MLLKSKIEELTYEELQCYKEEVCAPCKSLKWFEDSDCRFTCEAFREAVRKNDSSI